MKNKKGFTLVELIVVIAIIGILAAVLIPTIGGYIEKAHRGKDVELAGNMTNEVSLFAADNGIDVKDLTGTDVRTILLFSDYDLVPRKDKWVFAFDRKTSQVVVVDVDKSGNIMFADTSSVSNNSTQLNTIMLLGDPVLPYEPIDPTHINQNYFLISKGKSKIEKAVDLLLNLKSKDDYETALQGLESNYTKILSRFNPIKTLYLSNADAYTSIEDEANKIRKIVVLELTSHLPKIDGVVASRIELVDQPIISNTIKTSEKGSQIKGLFRNVKDVDLSKVLIIAIDPIGTDYNNVGDNKYLYKIDFTKQNNTQINLISDSYKQVIKDEIISIFKSNDKYIIKREMSVSLYNKEGLFAYGSMIYAVSQNK